MLEADWLGDARVVIRVGSGIELDGRRIVEPSGRVFWMRASPDGTQVAAISHDNGLHSVMLVDRSGKKTLLVRSWKSIEGLAWRPDGREIWFTGNRLGTVNALHAVDLAGTVREVFRTPATIVLHDIDKTGRLLVSRDIVTRDAALRRTGVPVDSTLSWFDWTFPVGISDSGDRVLFNEMGDAAPDDPVGSLGFLRRLDGSPAIKLIDSTVVALSPDGEHVLAWDPASVDAVGETTMVSRERLLVIPTGPGKPRMLKPGPIAIYNNAAFSADGRVIVFQGQEGSARGRSRIYRQELDGEPRAITPIGTGWPDQAQPLSNDNAWVFTSDKIYPVVGGEPRTIPGLKGSDVPIRWARDGRLFVQRIGMTTTTIHAVDISTGRWEELYMLAPADPVGVDIAPRAVVTPDGKTCAYSYRRRLSQLFVVSGLR